MVASSGGVSGTASVTVTTVVADFSLSVSPASQSVRRGKSAVYSVTIARSNGFNGAVNLSLAGQPTGSTVTFTPNPATTSTTLTITTSSNATRKTYPLTITGVSGSLTHTAGASLALK